MKPVIFLSLCGLVLGGALRAEDPAVAVDPTMGPVENQATPMLATLLVVEVPNAEALALLPKLRDPAQIEAATAAVMDLVKQKRGFLIGWPMLRSQSGYRSHTTMGQVVRYVDFPDAEALARINGGGFLGQAPPKEPGKKEPAKKEPARPLFANGPLTLETANEGLSFEIECTMQPGGGQIESHLEAAHLESAGMDHTEIKIAGQAVTFEHPRFRANTVRASFTHGNGERLLIGSFPALARPDFTELFLYQNTATPLPKPAPGPGPVLPPAPPRKP